MLCSNKWVIQICLQVSSPFEEVARNHARTPRVRVLSRLASPAIIGELARRVVEKQNIFLLRILSMHTAHCQLREFPSHVKHT